MANDLTTTNPPVTKTPEEIQAATFSTPAPPNDPASLRGARENPLYIGPTNFSNIQKQYTPYQIEQATTRDANGDIFWKQGVDIAKLPPSSNGTTSFNAPTDKPPLPSSQGTTSGTVNMSTDGSGNEMFKAQSAAATQYLGGVQKTIDDLLARQQAQAEQDKATAQASVNSLTDRLKGTLDQTQYQDQLAKDRELFNTRQMIQDLGNIRNKIADASSALDQGIIYEESRPVRMGLLTGRSAELKKQGLAQLGALQSSAEIIKGNIDLARAYADDSLAAVRQDNDEKNKALNTLLDMENAKLVKLSDEEKAAIKSRMDLLQDESKNLQKNKDDVFELAQKYPSAFSKSGVTFTDSREQALAKMMPNLAEYERLALEKERLTNDQLRSAIEENKAQAKKYLSGGSGSGGSGGSAPSSFNADIKSFIVDAYANGKTDEDVIKVLQQELGRPLDKKEIDYLKGMFATLPKSTPDKTTTAKDLLDNYAINPNENPELIGKTEAEIRQYLIDKKSKTDAEAAVKKPGFMDKVSAVNAKIGNKVKSFFGFGQ